MILKYNVCDEVSNLSLFHSPFPSNLEFSFLSSVTVLIYLLVDLPRLLSMFGRTRGVVFTDLLPFIRSMFCNFLDVTTALIIGSLNISYISLFVLLSQFSQDLPSSWILHSIFLSLSILFGGFWFRTQTTGVPFIHTSPLHFTFLLHLVVYRRCQILALYFFKHNFPLCLNLYLEIWSFKFSKYNAKWDL